MVVQFLFYYHYLIKFPFEVVFLTNYNTNLVLIELKLNSPLLFVLSRILKSSSIISIFESGNFVSLFIILPENVNFEIRKLDLNKQLIKKLLRTHSSC